MQRPHAFPAFCISFLLSPDTSAEDPRERENHAGVEVSLLQILIYF